MRFGKIKVYAHRFFRGQSIPLFADNNINRAINAHYDRIRRAQTRRRRDGSKYA